MNKLLWQAKVLNENKKLTFIANELPKACTFLYKDSKTTLYFCLKQISKMFYVDSETYAFFLKTFTHWRNAIGIGHSFFK